MAYGAYGLRSSEYRLQVQERGKAETLGSNSATLTAATACAGEHDGRLHGRAAGQIEKPAPGR